MLCSDPLECYSWVGLLLISSQALITAFHKTLTKVTRISTWPYMFCNLRLHLSEFLRSILPRRAILLLASEFLPCLPSFLWPDSLSFLSSKSSGIIGLNSETSLSTFSDLSQYIYKGHLYTDDSLELNLHLYPFS